MNKTAISLKTLPWKAIGRHVLGIGAGSAGGAAIGRYAAPKLLHYSDDPTAVGQSTAMNAMEGALAGLYAVNPATRAWVGKKVLGAPFAWGATEMLPSTLSRLTESSRAIKEQAKAINEYTNKPTTMDQIKELLTSRTATGVGIGAAGAGLASLLTGTLRRKSEAEEENKATRSKMVKDDFLKLLLPALIAGGVGGSLTGKG